MDDKYSASGNIVDALFEGKIVRVPEEYAKREGLLILRKQNPLKRAEQPSQVVVARRKKEYDERRFSLDDLRKPLNWQKDQVIKDLIDDFHWAIVKARRSKNITRKQLAQAIGASENDIKLMENGLLPTNDYVLVNKLQSYLGINLRMDGQDFITPARKAVEKASQKENEKIEISKKEDESEELAGDEIELDEE